MLLTYVVSILLLIESVEQSVYLVGGSGRAETQINITPHEYELARMGIVAIHVMNVLLPLRFENCPDFQQRMKLKHFHQLFCRCKPAIANIGNLSLNTIDFIYSIEGT